MRRQLGAMLVGLLLLCAPLAWSQSDSSSNSSSSDSSSSASSSGSSSSSAPGDLSPSSPSGDSSSNPPVSSGTLFTTWAQDESTQTQSSGDTGQGSPGDTTQSGASGSQDTFLNAEKLPPLNLFHEATSHTGATWFFSTGSLFQKPSGGGYNGSLRYLSTFNSGLTLSQVRSSYAWVVNYTGGMNVTTGGGLTSAYTNLNQSATADIRWRIAKLWSLKATDSYFYSDNPFTPFLTVVGDPTPNNPNPVVYFPQAIIEQNQARLNLSHPLSEHDTLVFGAGESFQRYVRAGPAYSLWNNYTYSGSAFYQHEFSSRLAAGGGYQYLAIDYGHGLSRSGVGTFEGFVQYHFTPTLQGSVWVGPERTGNKSIVCTFFFGNYCFMFSEIHTSQFSVAEGGNLTWKRSAYDSFGLNFSHNVSNGGLNVGVANVYQLSATYNRRLNRAWNLGAAVWGAKNTSINASRGNLYLNNFSGAIGVSRKLFNDAWNFRGYYLYVHQKQNYFGLPSLTTDNGLGFELRYAWHFGLGR